MVIGRLCKGVHGDLMVTEGQFNSYLESAKSFCVDARGPNSM